MDSPDPRSFNASPLHAAFLLQLANFTQDAFRLSEAWQGLQNARFEVPDNGTYPFAASFDDLVLEIRAWQEAISNNWTGKTTANDRTLALAPYLLRIAQSAQRLEALLNANDKGITHQTGGKIESIAGELYCIVNDMKNGLTWEPSKVWDNDGTDRAHLLRLLGFASPVCFEVSRSKWADLPSTIREDITAAWKRAANHA